MTIARCKHDWNWGTKYMQCLKCEKKKVHIFYKFNEIWDESNEIEKKHGLKPSHTK